MSKSKIQRGRPKGSQNKDYEVILTVPATCQRPNCGSTMFNTVPGQRTIVKQISGMVDGVIYHQMTWTRKRCAACGQHVSIREYHNMQPASK